MERQKNLLKASEIVDREELQRELHNFKEFALKKSILELSIAVILGGAANKVVAALSGSLIMPIINAVLSYTGTEWREVIWHPTENMPIEIGKLMGASVDFTITALVLYILFAKLLRRVQNSCHKI